MVRNGRIRVAGCDIAWRSEGEGEPALLLVHGGGAHAGWWDGTIRAAGPRQLMLSIDLSGHGDSGRRDEYRFATWAEEVAEVARTVAGGPVAIVAHSLGGRTGVVCAARHPDLVRALVLVDAVIPTRPDEPFPSLARERRVYPDQQSAVARFRLRPQTPDVPPETLAALARDSIMEVEGGWTWKFDERVFLAADGDIVDAALREVQVPVTVVTAADTTIVGTDEADAIEVMLGRPVSRRRMPGTHHLMLEDPAAMAALLAQLPDTRPLASA